MTTTLAPGSIAPAEEPAPPRRSRSLFLSNPRRFRVLVVGGGSAGMTVAARLRRARPGLELAILEPSADHYYQPLWTLVGGGVVRKEVTRRPQASLIPEGAAWLKDTAVAFRPEESLVVTAGGEAISYDALVVCPGIQLDWDGVGGLPAAVGRDGVCSIYSYQQVDRVWEEIRSFEGGTAVFSFPSTPIKCPGAAQKIMYLADDHFRRAGVRDRSRIVFVSAAPRIFGVDRYARTLERVLARKGIETLFRHELVAVDSCPLVTGYGRLVLAEFDYDGIPRETFPFDQSKERYSMYQLKKRGLPLLYWQGMMRGRA